MTPPTPAEMLAALRAGPFGGRGGVTALAEALGVHKQTLKLWRAGIGPDYAHRQTLAAIWQEHCGGER